MNKKRLANLKKRLSNPLFLMAVASGLYQLLEKYGQAPEFGVYQLWVDIITFALLGGGIYSTFDRNGITDKK